MKPPPKVFIVDDDPAALGWMEAFLTAQSYDVQSFASAEEFIAQHQPTQVGCVLLDLAAPGLGGSELIRHLHETRSLLSVVIISGLIDVAAHHQHQKEPVPNLAKVYELWILLTMIEDAIAGSEKRNPAFVETVSSQVEGARHSVVNVRASDATLKLSPRQRQVLSFLLAGNALKEVAQKLSLSEHTVGDYVKQIYKHFSVSSRAALLALFITDGQS